MYITEDQKRLINSYHNDRHKLEIMLPDLERAISHAVNCKNIDTATNTPDCVLAQQLAPLVLEYLLGITGAQLCEQMTPEEKAIFFGPNNQGDIEKFVPPTH